MKDIIDYLKNNNYSISTMESCTGGYISNSITNIEGASEIFSFGAVTYSNEYKIKLGVSQDIIKKYSVYNMETAKEMSRAISFYTGSSYGIGVTGKLNKVDPKNPHGNDNEIYISIYDKMNDRYITLSLFTKYEEREKNKAHILDNLICLFKDKIIIS